MNRGILPGVLGLAFVLLAASSVSAETQHPLAYQREYNDRPYRGGFEHRTMLRVHMGLSSPSGDFGDIAQSGLGVGGSIGYGVGRSTIISGGVAFHHFGNEGIDGHTNIVPITAAVDYGFNTRGSVRPWISGGLGLYDVSFEDVLPGGTVSDSESDLGFNFGFGIAAPMHRAGTAWGAGFKFHHVDGDQLNDMNFVTFQGGFSFEL